jgi:hypothetical protein
MTDLVDRSEIERLVGARRSSGAHLARADSAAGKVYILHSQRCLDTGMDLRGCRYSIALDFGIDMADWADHEDETVALRVYEDRLIPISLGRFKKLS